jgi:hypothetical protein
VARRPAAERVPSKQISAVDHAARLQLFIDSSDWTAYIADRKKALTDAARDKPGDAVFALKAEWGVAERCALLRQGPRGLLLHLALYRYR